MTLIAVFCFWVLAATLVALLPMRFQYVPGIFLMLAAPVLIYLICRDVALWAGIAAAFAFISMFRNPLRFLAKQAMGRKVEDSK